MTYTEFIAEHKRLSNLPFREQLALAGLTKAALSRELNSDPSTITKWGNKAPAWVCWGLASYIIAKKLI
jgi:hypothetical protein